MLDIIFYIAIFIIGALFGSFFSLAVYRIPIKQSIMHGRSYCPKCEHKLQFLDLIPILSYICLRGKCRYCKNKIRARYLYLEIISAIIFVLFALSFKISIYNLEINKIVNLFFGYLYLCSLFIIGAIEKEHHIIQKTVLIFELMIEALYMIYLCIVNINIYRYVIYLLLIAIFILFNAIMKNKSIKDDYIIQAFILFAITLIYTQIIELFALCIAITLILVIVNKFIMKNKSENNEKIPVIFYFCYTNIILIILYNCISYYYI